MPPRPRAALAPRACTGSDRSAHLPTGLVPPHGTAGWVPLAMPPWISAARATAPPPGTAPTLGYYPRAYHPQSLPGDVPQASMRAACCRRLASGVRYATCTRHIVRRCHRARRSYLARTGEMVSTDSGGSPRGCGHLTPKVTTHAISARRDFACPQSAHARPAQTLSACGRPSPGQPGSRSLWTARPDSLRPPAARPASRRQAAQPGPRPPSPGRAGPARPVPGNRHGARLACSRCRRNLR